MRAPSAASSGRTSSVASIASPTTIALAIVPSPGRWRSGIHSSRITKLVATVAAPTLSGVCFSMPSAKTVHGRVAELARRRAAPRPRRRPRGRRGATPAARARRASARAGPCSLGGHRSARWAICAATARSSPANPISSARSGSALASDDAEDRAARSRAGRPSTPSRTLEVAVPVLAPRADDRDGHDRQQRRRLGLEVRQPEEDRQRRDEERAAADAEEPRDHAGHDADERRLDHVPTSSLTASATSSAAKPSEIHLTGTRCCSQVPNRTPPTAGTPTSRPSSTWTFP